MRVHPSTVAIWAGGAEPPFLWEGCAMSFAEFGARPYLGLGLDLRNDSPKSVRSFNVHLDLRHSSAPRSSEPVVSWKLRGGHLEPGEKILHDVLSGRFQAEEFAFVETLKYLVDGRDSDPPATLRQDTRLVYEDAGGAVHGAEFVLLSEPIPLSLHEGALLWLEDMKAINAPRSSGLTELEELDAVLRRDPDSFPQARQAFMDRHGGLYSTIGLGFTEVVQATRELRLAAS